VLYTYQSKNELQLSENTPFKKNDTKENALSKTVFFPGLVMRNFTDHGNVFLSSTVNKIIVILRAYVITKKNTKEKNFQLNTILNG
jgi:hypothetical protein